MTLNLTQLLNSLRWFPFQEKPELDLPLTPQTSKTKHLIYIFRNKSEEIYLIGKTDQFLAKRFSSYLTSIRHPHSEGGRRPFSQDVRKAPEQFDAAIIYEAVLGQDLGFVETLLINLFKIAGLKLYNQNQGNGGGSTRPLDEIPFDETKLTAEEKIYQTPQKYFPLQVIDDKIQVPLSPTTKNLEGVVYVFKNVKTDHRLVGVTGQKIHKRLSGYTHAFNHPSSISGRRPLPRAVRAHPGDFVFGVLKKVEDTRRMFYEEKRYIYLLRQLFPLYNQNSGGAGSSATGPSNVPSDLQKMIKKQIKVIILSTKPTGNQIQIQDRKHLAEIVKLFLICQVHDKENASSPTKRPHDLSLSPNPSKRARVLEPASMVRRVLFPDDSSKPAVATS